MLRELADARLEFDCANQSFVGRFNFSRPPAKLSVVPGRGRFGPGLDAADSGGNLGWADVEFVVALWAGGFHILKVTV
ncbi:MAG TPA: hypothetical protein VFE51_29715 [Verrucomicrobiae bacterium]|nr:hypothetical protein [Verrucomicrobiae bacterium]